MPATAYSPYCAPTTQKPVANTASISHAWDDVMPSATTIGAPMAGSEMIASTP